MRHSWAKDGGLGLMSFVEREPMTGTGGATWTQLEGRSVKSSFRKRCAGATPYYVVVVRLDRLNRVVR